MTAVQVAILIVLAPLLQGSMHSLRARLSGRPGPPVLQPYRQLRKLASKEAVVASNASALVSAAPGIAIGVSLTLALLVPPLIHRDAAVVDVVALALTIALGRFMLVLASLDTRSSFAGMAASREMLFAGLTEAPLILALAATTLVHDTLSRILAAAAIVLVMLSETARIPVDNQETHYELTMVHEGLLLEYSGWQLAMLQAAAYVRQASFFVLAATALPGPPIAVAAWLAFLAVLIPVVERCYGKMRFFEVPQLFASATLLAVAGLGLRILGVAF